MPVVKVCMYYLNDAKYFAADRFRRKKTFYGSILNRYDFIRVFTIFFTLLTHLLRYHVPIFVLISNLIEKSRVIIVINIFNRYFPSRSVISFVFMWS